jgi:hypothetical protein
MQKVASNQKDLYSVGLMRFVIHEFSFIPSAGGVALIYLDIPISVSFVLTVRIWIDS